MSICSVTFFACLLPAVVLFYALPGRLRAGYLLLLSYAVYWTFSPQYLLLLVGETLLTYLISGAIAGAASTARKRQLLVLGVGMLCGLLVVIKLKATFIGLFSGILPTGIPIGISYLTFRQMGHLAEVSWEPAAHERRLVRFAVWVAFFPQLVSGPIQRSGEFLPQLEQTAFQRSDFAAVERACGLILAGLFQKLVLADRMGLFVAAVDAQPEGCSRLVLLLASYACILQVFADFAGYTSLALGLGQLFGIAGPQNFNAPFSAASPQEFWSRWHMSLTRWLMDYVYTPLRMRLRRWGRWGLAASLMTTLLIIGVWHRFSTGYLVFGILHGAMLVAVSLSLERRDRFFTEHPTLRRARRGIGILFTFHWVAFVQLFARTPTAGDGLHVLGLLLHSARAKTIALPFDLWLPALLSGTTALAWGAGLLDGIGARLSFVPNWIAYSLVLLTIILLSASNASPFLYMWF